jgi:hypothetical protein
MKRLIWQDMLSTMFFFMEIFLIAAWEIKSGSFEMLSSLKGNEALCRLGSEISKN